MMRKKGKEWVGEEVDVERGMVGKVKGKGGMVLGVVKEMS